MRTIKDILREEMEEEQKLMNPIRELLRLKYKTIVEDLQKDCTHKWEDGKSALTHLIDDDCGGYNTNPTYEEWDLCEICDKVFESK